MKEDLVYETLLEINEKLGSVMNAVEPIPRIEKNISQNAENIAKNASDIKWLKYFISAIITALSSVGIYVKMLP